jgi:hypothetical protein
MSLRSVETGDCQGGGGEQEGEGQGVRHIGCDQLQPLQK